jgi:hypothetical protein
MVSVRRIARRVRRGVSKTVSKAARLTKKTIINNASSALKAAGKTIDKSVRKGVMGGLGSVSSRIAKTVGAKSLLKGIKQFSNVVNKSVSIALKFAKCAKWAKNPAFWALVGVLYAARLKGWIKKKKDVTKFAESKKFKALVGKIKIPIASILPCAAEVAFRTPRPR